MPCDSIQIMQVDLNLANADVLKAAIQQHLGGVFVDKQNFMVDGQRFSIRDGQLVGDSRNVGQMADRIRRAYSQEVVDRASRRFGWQKKTVGNKVTLTRRGN